MNKQNGKMRGERLGWNSWKIGSRKDNTSKLAFTLIELIIVMSVLAVLMLLATPKLLGYTEKARFTRDIHLAKTLETGLEDFMVHGGILKDHLDVISRDDIQKSADKNMLLNPRGFVEVVENGVYYELTYDFIKNHLNIKVAKNEKINDILIEAMAAQYPVAAYAEQGGKALVDRTRGLRGHAADAEPEYTAPEVCPTPESLNFEFDHLTGTIIKYTGTEVHLNIPPFLLVDEKCYRVRIIGKEAFMGKGILTIQLPPTIITIEDGAFSGNNLTNLIIPEGTKSIGDNAFKNNFLGTDMKPNNGSITEVGTFPSGHSGVILPDNSLESIGIGAFENNKLESIVIPDSVKNIGDNAFKGNNVSVIDMPTNIIIGENIFAENKSTTITIPAGVKTIPANTFKGSGIISVVFPEGLERIEDYAFAYNQIVEVNLPSSLVYVGNYAFAYNQIGNTRTTTSITFKGKEYTETLNSDGDITVNGLRVNELETLALDAFIFKTLIDDNQYVNIPGHYVLASDEDFRYVQNTYAPNKYAPYTVGYTQPGSFVYIGTDAYVIIPPVIHGYEVTDYFHMFNYTNVVKGVASNNPKVTNFMWMFMDSRVHSELDLQYLNTSNVTNMYGMFLRASYEIDVSGFNTSKVTNMEAMFEGVDNEILDLRNFDTSNVTNMRSMFAKTSSLTSLDISSFDTTNVVNMHYMFEYSSLPTINLNHFDTVGVETMYGMFKHSKATSIIVDSFDTTSLNSLSAMFQYSQAHTLDLSSFEFNHIVPFLKETMFTGCTATTVYVKNQADADSLRLIAPETMNFVVK